MNPAVGPKWRLWMTTSLTLVQTKIQCPSWISRLLERHHDHNCYICDKFLLGFLGDVGHNFTNGETEMLKSLPGIKSRHHPDSYCLFNVPSSATRTFQDFLMLSLMGSFGKPGQNSILEGSWSASDDAAHTAFRWKIEGWIPHKHDAIDFGICLACSLWGHLLGRRTRTANSVLFSIRLKWFDANGRKAWVSSLPSLPLGTAWPCHAPWLAFCVSTGVSSPGAAAKGRGWGDNAGGETHSSPLGRSWTGSSSREAAHSPPGHSCGQGWTVWDLFCAVTAVTASQRLPSNAELQKDGKHLTSPTLCRVLP